MLTQKHSVYLTENCKICHSTSHYFSTAKILQKYDVNYFQCSNCGFVQTEHPYWLDEAYSEAITASDVGLVYRNNMMANITGKLLVNYFDHQAKFLDYGGGYGLFVRLMRDKGFNFYWFDKFCKNIFSQGFELQETDKQNLEIITAFELFEHLTNPLQDLKEILDLCPNILFSTELLPKHNPTPDKWWYYTPHEGQHISIYTQKSLEILASKYNLQLYTDGKSLHLLTAKVNLPENLFESLAKNELQSPNKESLLYRDFNQIVNSILLKTRGLNQSENFSESKQPIIIIDGVFFQLYQTGIARVWRSLLQQWANTEFANHILVLDRDDTAPKISGIRYLTISRYNYNNTEADKQMLQQICDQQEAELFISSYYTTPINTPSVFMAYDMIPEVLGGDLNEPMWREKHNGIKHASAYISISENTAKDLSQLFSDIPLESITVAHCGVDPLFSPVSKDDIKTFKYKYGINKPYFLLVGTGAGYKNGILFFQAFSQLASSYGFDIICTGIGGVLAPDLRTYTSGSAVHMLQLSDEELAIAYSGAVAIVYPSKYEGFGMPLLEAMACGCPVITCPNASIPEVTGEAAIYVNDNDVEALTNALCEVQKPNIRKALITAGLAQTKKFSWTKMAQTVSSALINATLLSLNLRETNLIIFPDWSQPEDELGLELTEIIKALSSYPDSDKITLLIHTSNIDTEEAAMFLSSITMNLLLEDDLDITEGLELSLVSNLATMQWDVLLARVSARITLEHEDEQVLSQLSVDKIPSCEIHNLSKQLNVLLKEKELIRNELDPNFITYNIKEIPIKLPKDHALPLYQARFRLYDKFIGIIAKHLPNSQDFIVDIGANVGDTSALMLQYCLNPIICIEADKEFFSLLKFNLLEYQQRITFVNSFVSKNGYKNVELVKNKGTARAVETENKLIESNSLESILKNLNLGKCILLKTDTDGFDFEILLSSLSRIEEDTPILYWENEISSIKDIELAKDLLKKLADMNYTKYIVIDNFGNPLIYEGSSQLVEQMNEYLLNNVYTKNNTFYYTDIAAFPDRYSHLILPIASEYNNFIRSSNLYP